MSLVQRKLTAPALPNQARGSSFQIKVLASILARLEVGRLEVVLPDGRSCLFDGRTAGPSATLEIVRWRTMWRTLLRGDVGFAESVIDGDCTSPSMAKVVELFVRNEAALATIAGFAPFHFLNKLFHLKRGNSRRGSRRNILAHYDLGNDFFKHWLDSGMTYSSGLYAQEDVSLEAAQRLKQDRVLAELDLMPAKRVLEIGFGWGGLVERIVQKGCAVTGLTLSPSQLAYAGERLAAAGHAEASDLRLEDYRDVRGTFDRIVSIEMLEAVGRAYWPSYFAAIRERLAKDGQAVLQVITLADDRYAIYHDQVDFIQRYVFPGGMLPSPAIMREQITAAGLALKSSFTFGESYARTLAEWSRRFQAALPHIEAMGFDKRFQRLWTYYLAYCEGGFRAGILDVGLYTITHAPAAAGS